MYGQSRIDEIVRKMKEFTDNLTKEQAEKLLKDLKDKGLIY